MALTILCTNMPEAVHERVNAAADSEQDKSPG